MGKSDIILVVLWCIYSLAVWWSGFYTGYNHADFEAAAQGKVGE